MSENIYILRFQSSFTSQIVELILNIQQNEFFIPITQDDQPDLLDIENFYQQGNGNFWVAITDNKVIGTIALLDIGNQQIALRKMFVHADYRGKEKAVAQQLLETVFDWCFEKNIYDIFLGTIDKFIAARKFYEKNGFDLIEKEKLPANFPIMAVDNYFYVKHF